MDDNRRATRFLIGTIVVGIVVVFVTGMLLRYPVKTDPFDHPAGAPNVSSNSAAPALQP